MCWQVYLIKWIIKKRISQALPVYYLLVLNFRFQHSIFWHSFCLNWNIYTDSVCWHSDFRANLQGLRCKTPTWIHAAGKGFILFCLFLFVVAVPTSLLAFSAFFFTAIMKGRRVLLAFSSATPPAYSWLLLLLLLWVH